MEHIAQEITSWTDPAAELHGADRPMDFVLVCEHASAHIPNCLDDLGLSSAARFSHVAWDIGARDLAIALADQMQAPLVLGAISRLVYDCNRPFEATDCIPIRSEAFDVPGNADLSDTERQARYDLVHTPFHTQVARVLSQARPDTVLATIHSFTPVFEGRHRELEIGYLVHGDDRMALAAQAQELQALRHMSALNEPYSATDGVTYTLRKHGDDRGLLNVMIEVRNDLVDTPDQATAMARHLAGILRRARAQVLS